MFLEDSALECCGVFSVQGLMYKPKVVAGKSPDEPILQSGVDLKSVPEGHRHV